MCQGPTELLWIGCLTGLIVDPKIQIRYIDTRQLSKGNFTRDEWNNLLQLFNISHLSYTCCTKNLSLISCSTMAKRIQEQKRSRKSCVQVATNTDKFVFLFYCDKFLRRMESDCIYRSRMPIASEKPDSWMSSNSFDTASTSQVRLKDAYLGGLMEEHRRDPSHQEEEEDSDNPEAQNSKAWWELLAHGASSSVNKESQKDTDATWRHYLQVSPHTSQYTEDVFSMFRCIYGKQPDDLIKYLSVNLAIWWMFMNTTFRAAVHLGKDYEVNLRCVKNHLWKIAGQLFKETEMLVRGQTQNRWHKHDQFPRIEVGIDKLTAQSSLSIFHCQSQRLLRLCTVFGKDGRRSCWIVEEANSMVFGQQLFQRFESNWWTTCGIRVEDFPRTHYNGYPQLD